MPHDSSSEANDHRNRTAYTADYAAFVQTLSSEQKRALESAKVSDWQSPNSFAFPTRKNDPAYISEPGDPVFETLEELKSLPGALPKIATWIGDQVNGVNLVLAMEQFRIALARISEAKNPRLESYMVSLAIGMNLLGNANGYAIAEHFGLKAQTFHEGLTETCKALGVAKPLAKVNKARYLNTQYRHPVKRRT